ncbi:hypothetical protein [Chitinophaga filiformis]|uniref:Uncharacterized protein n=1 Tax=Chitinophaga filiformis TaxID=104663 RepID=A0A1G7XUS8_CHIFI|nr:hypothetical protein [Chitinophaga filiformis]SDG87942.1 hypothetical protein SAMN04488121_10790 [Chitinophaga filiformis]
MQIRNILMAMLCMSLSLSVQGQTDSSTTKTIFSKPKKPINFTKLELVYQKETVKTTGASYSGAGFRLAGANPGLPGYQSPTYSNVNAPYIRVNGGELRRLDKRANMLRPYYTKAPLANEQLTLMNQQRRRGAVQGWTLVGIGTVATAVGLYSAVTKSDDEDSKYSASLLQTIAKVLPGLAVAYAGFALNRYHTAKAKKHLEQSLEIYNKQYYKPIKADSTVNRAGNTDSTVLKSLAPEN